MQSNSSYKKVLGSKTSKQSQSIDRLGYQFNDRLPPKLRDAQISSQSWKDDQTHIPANHLSNSNSGISDVMNFSPKNYYPPVAEPIKLYGEDYEKFLALENLADTLKNASVSQYQP